EILFLEHDEFAFFVFVTFNDLLPRHFFAIGFGHAFVINRAEVARAQQAEFQLFPPRGRVESNRYVNETETDGTFPDRTHQRKVTCARKSATGLMTQGPRHKNRCAQKVVKNHRKNFPKKGLRHLTEALFRANGEGLRVVGFSQKFFEKNFTRRENNLNKVQMQSI